MKKIMCITVSLLLLIAAAIVPSFGESAQSEGLEKAIKKVKSVVPIPEEYSEFYYSSYQREGDGGRSVTVWSLEWSKEDGSAAVSAQADSGGNLLSFYSFKDSQNKGLAKIERAEGQKQADAFLARAMPSLSKNMRMADGNNSAGLSDDLTYTYQLYVNDIPASFINAEIRVNKYTGEVSSFNGLEAGQTVPDFPGADGCLSKDEALKLYEEKLGPQLSYFTTFDYQKKELKVFAGYAMNDSGNQAVDARTGDVVKLSDGYMLRYGAAAENAKDMGAGGGDGFSPIEREALDSVAGLISKEKAESILRAAADSIKSSQKVTTTYLNKDMIDQDRYLWRIVFEDAYGTVDARTGEVLSFSVYLDTDQNSRVTLSEEQALKKAEDFAKNNAQAKLDQTKLDEREQNSYGDKEDEITSYVFSFVRQVNGIDVTGNGITVIVDARTGLITGYDTTWYDNAKFPSVENVIGKGEAFRLFDKNGNLRLTYAMTGDDQVVLVYDFESRVTSWLVDPFSGARIGRNGKPYEEGSTPVYSDIAGHWAESTIIKLLNNGYYLKGDAFEPDRMITQEDFLRYLYTPGWSDDEQDDFYRMLERDQIVLSGEKDPEKAVTRQEAAKYMVRYLGFESLAKKSTIFKDVFTDQTADGYKGYAAICYGLDIMKGDEKGRFNGTQAMTRAEAACALCQLMEIK